MRWFVSNRGSYVFGDRRGVRQPNGFCQLAKKMTYVTRVHHWLTQFGSKALANPDDMWYHIQSVSGEKKSSARFWNGLTTVSLAGQLRNCFPLVERR